MNKSTYTLKLIEGFKPGDVVRARVSTYCTDKKVRIAKGDRFEVIRSSGRSMEVKPLDRGYEVFSMPVLSADFELKEGLDTGVTTRDDLGEPTKMAVGIVRIQQPIEPIFTELLQDRDFLELMNAKKVDEMERYVMAKYGMDKTKAQYIVNKLLHDKSLVLKILKK